MTTRTRWGLLLVVWAAALLLACAGGQSTDDAVPEGMNAGGGAAGAGGAVAGTGVAGTSGGFAGTGIATDYDQCDETETPLALDEASPLGFAADAVLSFAAGTHEAVLTYDPEASTAVRLTPSTAESAVTFVVEADGGATFVETMPSQRSGGGLTISPSCEPRMEIGVSVTMTTADGAFAETLEGKLVATSAGEATLSLPLDLDALSGTFAVEVIDPAEGEAIQTTLSATFREAVFVGEVAGLVEYIGPGWVMATSVTYAAWGRGDCDRASAPVQDGPITAAELVDLVNETPLSVAWADGSSADLDLVASSPGTLCLYLDGASAEEQMTYLLAAQLAMTSSDGRLETTRPMSMRAHATGDAVELLELDFVNSQGVDPSEFEATHGLMGVDVNGYLDVGLTLSLDYTYTVSDPPEVSGELRVVGIAPSTCMDTPNSSCGSPGAQDIEVATISD